MSKINTIAKVTEQNPVMKPLVNKSLQLTLEDMAEINTAQGLKKMLKHKQINFKGVLSDLSYEKELKKLQIELVKLQQDIQRKGRRVAIIFEGRDAAGKGGSIRRFAEHLNPRAMRVVALPKPSETEQGQWYFQRYINTLPNVGEIVFYDRSWYNRAVVEPVMGFCTKQQHKAYLRQVPEFEHMLYEDGVEIIKFWLSISKEEQAARFESRKANPLKQWKLSPIDEKAQEHWDTYTKYKQEMFSRTHTSYSPWIVVKANNKKRARLASMHYVLNYLDYEKKDSADFSLNPDPNIVMRFHRLNKSID